MSSTKNRLNPQLKPLPLTVRVLTFFMSKKIGFRLFNNISKWLEGRKTKGLNDETVEYVERLKQADIPVKFKVFEGCYHGFEVITAKKQISKDAMNFLYDSYAEFYDKYIL